MTGAHIDPVATELGGGRMYAAVPADPRLVLLLGHGAGGGVGAPDLVALTALTADGVAVLRFEQPWRTAGKRVAPAPARLDLGWAAALAYARERFGGIPLVVGGRSAGARVACRAAGRADAAVLHQGRGNGAAIRGVVALSFPLHPPGRPEASRADELLAPACPVLVLQGERDPLGTPSEVAAVISDAPRHHLVEVRGCAHELRPAKRAGLDPEDVAQLLTESVSVFLGRRLRAARSPDRE